MFSAVEERSSNLLANLDEGNETTVVEVLPDGSSMAVSRLGSGLAKAVAAGSTPGRVPSFKVEVQASNMQDMLVEVPITILTDLGVSGDIALVVTALDSSSANVKGLGKAPDPVEGGVQLHVAGAAVIEVRHMGNNSAIDVGDLSNAITFTLPANYTPGMHCAFWDEGKEEWSREGVWVHEDSAVGELVICQTAHLSLFGAIVQSIIETVQCANILNLFNAAAMAQIAAGTWMGSMGAFLFGLLLLFLLICFMAAIHLDQRWSETYEWQDDFLLVHGDVPEQQATTPQAGQHGWLTSILCGCCIWMQDSEVIRAALDEVASSWFEYFGEVRTGVEACLDCVDTDVTSMGAFVTSFHFARASAKITGKMMLYTSRQAVAADMGVSVAVVHFVLDDEDLADYLTHERPERSENWRSTPEVQAAWAGLRNEVTHRMVRHTMKQGSTRPQFVKTFFTLCLTQNPVGALFAFDFFSTCKQRVLVFAAELLGALAVTCIFFEASGMARGKKVKGGVGCSSSDGGDVIAANIGRFFVIAMFCLLVAGLPVHLLSSLQTRGFKIMKEAPGSEAWHKQLRVWNFQAMLVGTLLPIYILCCVTYIIMFIANIGDEDHSEWTSTGTLALFQDILLVPCATALLVPLCAQVLLMLHLRITRVRREDFVRHVCEMLHNSSNAMLPIERL